MLRVFQFLISGSGTLALCEGGWRGYLRDEDH